MSPVNWVGYPLGFVSKNEVLKAAPPFGVLWTLLRLAILRLSRDNAETIEVGFHCFKCWNLIVIPTEKKMFNMEKEAYF